MLLQVLVSQETSEYLRWISNIFDKSEPSSHKLSYHVKMKNLNKSLNSEIVWDTEKTFYFALARPFCQLDLLLFQEKTPVKILLSDRQVHVTIYHYLTIQMKSNHKREHLLDFLSLYKICIMLEQHYFPQRVFCY